MLDAFKSKSGASKLQSDELQALIAASKEERAALSTMLTQVQLQSARLSSASKSLQEVDEKAGKAHTRLDEVTGRLNQAAARVTELEAIDARIKSLADSVAEAEKEAARLTAPDGELQKHRQAIQNLSSEALQARDSLDGLKRSGGARRAPRPSAGGAVRDPDVARTHRGAEVGIRAAARCQAS